MRKAVMSLLLAVVAVALAAPAASAVSISPSPAGNISASINRLGFTGFLISLFTCDVVLDGNISRGPITLPGNAGSITGASIRNCSGGHTVATRGLPWTLTAQSALSRCPSASTGVLGLVAAGFTIDGFVSSSGNIGTLVSSGRGSIAILSSRLSNSGQILSGRGTYSPTQTISCT